MLLVGVVKPRVLAMATLLCGVAGNVWAQDDDLDALFGSDSSSTSSTQAESSPSAQGQGQQQPPSQAQADAKSVPVVELQEEQVPSGAELAAAEQEAQKPAHLEEIVVTARKRSESIQEVPLSVTPFSAEDLEQRGFSGLDDIAAATPGFTFEAFQSGGAHGNAVIRGLAQQFTTSRIQNVSFFLDGVYLQRQSMLDLGMIDMERVEVVKGPQNALYGRNAFAGAVNYITLRPGAQPGGYLMATIGDNGREQYRLSASGPLDDSQTLFGKFSAGVSNYDGHTKNNHPVANADPAGENVRGNLGGHDDETFSLSLAWEPLAELRTRIGYYSSEMIHETSPGYSISGVNTARFGMRTEAQNDLNCNTATVPDIGLPSPTHNRTGYTLWCGELPNYASDVAERTVDGIVVDPRAVGFVGKTRALTFSLDYDITDSLTAYYLFGNADHSSYTDGGTSDEDPLVGRGMLTNAAVYLLDPSSEEAYTFANTASSRPNSELKSFSHELRFDWELNPAIRTSFGAYYSVVEDEEWTSLFINDLCNADTPENIANCNLPLRHPNSLADQTILTMGTAYDQFVRQHGGVNRGEWTAFKDEISALFASVTIDITDTLQTTLEARYTLESKEVERYTDSFMLGYQETVTYNLPEDPVMPLFANSIESSLVVPYDSEDYAYFTPRGIINWAFADDSMVYASVAMGVKSGGFNNADDPADLTYDEAENWTYEVGTKNQFFGRALTLNGAVYFIDWSGLQGGVPPSEAGLSTSDIITNIGGASSLGVELESRLHLPYGFSMDLGLTWNEATYDDEVKYAAGEQEDGAFHCDGVTCAADGSIGGNQLARTSKTQGTLGINYNTYLYGWDVMARLDTSYQSKQYLTPLNVGWVPDRQLYNGSFNVASPDGRWEVLGWVKNLTDEDYPSSAFVLGVFNQYLVGKGPGRTWGAALKFKF